MHIDDLNPTRPPEKAPPGQTVAIKEVSELISLRENPNLNYFRYRGIQDQDFFPLQTAAEVAIAAFRTKLENTGAVLSVLNVTNSIGELARIITHEKVLGEIFGTESASHTRNIFGSYLCNALEGLAKLSGAEVLCLKIDLLPPMAVVSGDHHDRLIPSLNYPTWWGIDVEDTFSLALAGDTRPYIESPDIDPSAFEIFSRRNNIATAKVEFADPTSPSFNASQRIQQSSRLQARVINAPFLRPNGEVKRANLGEVLFQKGSDSGNFGRSLNIPISPEPSFLITAYAEKSEDTYGIDFCQRIAALHRVTKKTVIRLPRTLVSPPKTHDNMIGKNKETLIIGVF